MNIDWTLPEFNHLRDSDEWRLEGVDKMNIDKLICKFCLQTYTGNCTERNGIREENCAGREKFKQKILQAIEKVIDECVKDGFGLISPRELKEKLGIKEKLT